jgi:hypothetical protein
VPCAEAHYSKALQSTDPVAVLKTCSLVRVWIANIEDEPAHEIDQAAVDIPISGRSEVRQRQRDRRLVLSDRVHKVDAIEILPLKTSAEEIPQREHG